MALGLVSVTGCEPSHNSLPQPGADAQPPKPDTPVRNSRDAQVLSPPPDPASDRMGVPLTEFTYLQEENGRIESTERKAHAAYIAEYGQPTVATPPFKTSPRLYARVSDGKRFFIKFRGQNDLNSNYNSKLTVQRVILEKLAYDLYGLLGMEVPESLIVYSDVGGTREYGIASSLDDGYQSLADYAKSKSFHIRTDNHRHRHAPRPPLEVNGLFDKFPVFMFLYDYDAIGSTLENVGVVQRHGVWTAIKIDPGAASLFNLPDGAPFGTPDLPTNALGIYHLPRAHFEDFTSCPDLVSCRATMDRIVATPRDQFEHVVMNPAISDRFFPPYMRQTLTQSLLERQREFAELISGHGADAAAPPSDFSIPIKISTGDLYAIAQNWARWTYSSPAPRAFGISFPRSAGGELEGRLTIGPLPDQYRILVSAANYGWLYFKLVNENDKPSTNTASHDRVVPGYDEDHFRPGFFSSDPNLCGWKVHVSLERSQENIASALQVVEPIVSEFPQAIRSYKVLNLDPANDLLRESTGKELVLYLTDAIKNADALKALLPRVEAALTAQHVRTGGLPVGSKPLLDGTRLFIRNDCGYWNDALVPEGLLATLKFTGSSGYNLSGTQDPLESLHWQPPVAASPSRRDGAGPSPLLATYRPSQNERAGLVSIRGVQRELQMIDKLVFNRGPGAYRTYNAFALLGREGANHGLYQIGQKGPDRGLALIEERAGTARHYFDNIVGHFNPDLSAEQQTQFVRNHFRYVPAVIRTVLPPCFDYVLHTPAAPPPSASGKKPLSPTQDLLECIDRTANDNLVIEIINDSLVTDIETYRSYLPFITGNDHDAILKAITADLAAHHKPSSPKH